MIKVAFKCSLRLLFAGLIVIAILIPHTTSLAASSQTVTPRIDLPIYGTVNISSGTLNVRSGPSTDYSILASLKKGTDVMIVGVANDYYRVQYNTNGKYGFVAKKYVNIVNQYYYVQITTSGGNVNLRSGPTTDSTIVAPIANKKYAPEMSKTTNGGYTWYRLLWGTSPGFVRGDYCREILY